MISTLDVGTAAQTPSEPAAAAVWTAVARSTVLGVERVIRGQHAAVELAVIAAISGGHVLVEDLPGSGKTTMARALAASLGVSFARIQATADLMPADITGSSIWDPSSNRLVFAPGPIFASLLLVDELNRTPPRTQSAFLEAMQENGVTVDGQRYPLPQPFMVVATQNPYEQHGTYPLPEGMLDRFAVRISFAALSVEDEVAVVREQLVSPVVDGLDPVVEGDTFIALQAVSRALFVSPVVMAYAVALVRMTRDHPKLRAGAGARAAIALVRCAQARALLLGREYVTPDDVQMLLPAVLVHRLVPIEAYGPGADVRAVVADIAATVPVPTRP